MATLLILLMMSFNVWMLIRLMREQPTHGDGNREEGGTSETTCDVVGRSRFQFPGKTPQAATTTPNAATPPECAEVEEKDVTFADEMPDGEKAGKFPRQVPAEKLDDTFSDLSVSEAGAEYDEEEYDGEVRQASGISFEEIAQAVDTVKAPEAGAAELDHAGRVFSDMEGNELFTQLTKSPELGRRIRKVLDRHLYEQERALPSRIPARKGVPENFEDFNVLDYV